MGAFKTSGRFGIIGVFAVAGICAWIATTFGQGEAKPRDAFALIFGVIAAYVVLLYLWLAERLADTMQN